MIAIIPAGGKATRMNGIPKWLLPVPRGTLLDILCRRMKAANPRETLIVAKGINTALLNHVMTSDVTIVDRDDQSMAHAVLLARDFAAPDENSIFGMPDTYWDADDVFVRLAQRLTGDTVAVAALWQVRPEQRGKLGQCAVDRDGCIVHIMDKNPDCTYPWVWGALAWSPAFWPYIQPDQPHVGYAVQAAIEDGRKVMAITSEGHYWDCGTASEYFECIRQMEGS